MNNVALVLSRAIIGVGGLLLIVAGVGMHHSLRSSHMVLLAAIGLLLATLGCFIQIPRGFLAITAYLRNIPGLIYSIGALAIAATLYAFAGGVISLVRYWRIPKLLEGIDTASDVLIIASAQFLLAVACGFFLLTLLRTNRMR